MRGARVVCLAVLLLHGSGAPADPAPPAAQGDPLLDALRLEIERSASGLALPGLERPYFLEYAGADLSVLDLTACLGALVDSRLDRARPLRPDVRVGSYELDNSEFLGRQGPAPRGTWGLVLEDDPIALRHDLWLATDAAYKQALERMAQKRAALRNRMQTEAIPDFSPSPPTVEIGPVSSGVFEVERWQGLVKRLSAVFREYPLLQDSRADLHAVAGARYLVNSEGTRIRQPFSVAGLVLRASAQAEDGMQFAHYAPFYARDLAGLPPEPTLLAAARRLAEELSALRSAPLLERYVGPVLFSGPASAEVFLQLLAPELSGQRPPLAEDDRTAARLPQGRLAERVGRRVLPVFLSVYDDPTRGEYAGRPLLGAYRYDEQGVAAQRVTLVEKGILRSLLMSRRPRREFAASNGHGRASVYGAPSAEIANLVIEASPGSSEAELEQALRDSCAQQGMEYGLRIELLDLPFLSGREDLRSRGQESLTPPVLAYKVYVADGRRELVRGLSVSDADVRTLREINAAGTVPEVWSRPYLGRGAGFSFTPGPIGTESLAVSVVAPAILFEEIEIKRAPGARPKPVLLPSPAAAAE